MPRTNRKTRHALQNIYAVTEAIQTSLPTKERSMKDDFELSGSEESPVRRKINTIKSLYEMGDIDDDARNAAERWLSDYLFSHLGYADFLHAPLPRDYIRGDIHTFHISRGKAGQRIAAVRENLGDCTHKRLVMLLVEESSFTTMGAKLYPDSPKSTSRARASAQSVLLLEQLACFYQKLRSRKRVGGPARHSKKYRPLQKGRLS